MKALSTGQFALFLAAFAVWMWGFLRAVACLLMHDKSLNFTYGVAAVAAGTFALCYLEQKARKR